MPALPLLPQSADAKFAKFVENARWEKSGVVFATLHIVGSNNNLQRDQALQAESHVDLFARGPDLSYTLHLQGRAHP